MIFYNPLAQHVSGIIMPIFRSARPYFTAYGFHHVMCWLVSWGAGKQAVCTVCTRSSAPGDGHNDARNVLS